MAHIHKVYDNDVHFKIDEKTGSIKNASEVKAAVTQYAHNSERFTFEIKRTVEGHDMSLCNQIQVHYINTDSKDKTLFNAGIHEVTDLQVCPEDEDVVICSWLIKDTATQYVGNLAFSVHFMCLAEDGSVDYDWPTNAYSAVAVVPSVNNAGAMNHGMEQWKFTMMDGSTFTKEVYVG